jgi:hypothetical protein
MKVETRFCCDVSNARHTRSRRAAATLQLALFAGLMAVACSPALAAKGAWKFELDAREKPSLSYSEGGKDMFTIGCGRAFGLHAAYPGSPKRTGKATVVIATLKAKMKFSGEIDGAHDDGRARFVEWDLGFDRRKPDAFGKAFWRRQARLLDLLDSGLPLTISAEGRRYVIPAVDAPGWRARFKQYC